MKPITYYCTDVDYCFGIADDAHKSGCSVQMDISITNPADNKVVIMGDEDAMKAFSDRRMDEQTN